MLQIPDTPVTQPVRPTSVPDGNYLLQQLQFQNFILRFELLFGRDLLIDHLNFGCLCEKCMIKRCNLWNSAIEFFVRNHGFNKLLMLMYKADLNALLSLLCKQIITSKTKF